MTKSSKLVLCHSGRHIAIRGTFNVLDGRGGLQEGGREMLGKAIPDGLLSSVHTSGQVCVPSMGGLGGFDRSEKVLNLVINSVGDGLSPDSLVVGDLDELEQEFYQGGEVTINWGIFMG